MFGSMSTCSKKSQKFANSQPKLPAFERSRLDFEHAETEFHRSIAEATLKAVERPSRSRFARSTFNATLYDNDDFFEAFSFSRSVALGLYDTRSCAKSSNKTENNFTRSVRGPEEKTPENYKTTLCYQWKDKTCCTYGENCRFAHGENELRLPQAANPHYKTVLCLNFSTYGECPYGSRCKFIHHRQRDDVPERLSPSSSSMTDSTHEFYSWDYLKPRFDSESSASP